MVIKEKKWSNFDLENEKFEIEKFWNRIFKEKNLFQLNPELIVKELKAKYCQEMKIKVQDSDDKIQNKFVFNDFRNMEKCNIPYLMKEFNFKTIPFGDEEWMFVLSRCMHHFDYVYSYLFTQDEKYLTRFFFEFETFINTERCIEQNFKTTWRTIDSAIRIVNWIKCFSLLQNIDFDLKYKKMFLKTVDEHFNYLFTNYHQLLMISNWGIMQFNALLVLSRMFETHPISIEHGEEILKEFNKQIEVQFNDDGSHWEQSLMYNYELLWNIFNVFLVLKNNKEEIKKETFEKIQKAVKFLNSMTDFDDNLILKGDTDSKNINSLLMGYHQVFNFPVAWNKFDSKFEFELLWENGIIFQNFDCYYPEFDSHYYKFSGDWIYRDFKRQNLIYFNAGVPTGGHSHGDLLHFNLILNGKYILNDSGRFTYVVDKGRKEYKGEEAHNTIGFENSQYLRQLRAWSMEYDIKNYTSHFVNQDYEYIETFSDAFKKLKTRANIFRSIFIRKDKYAIIISEADSQNQEIHSLFRFHFWDKNPVKISKDSTIKKNEILIYANSDSPIWSKSFASNTYNENFSVDLMTMQGQTGKSIVPILINLSDDDLEIKQSPVKYINGTIADDVILFTLKSQKFSESYYYKISYTAKNHTQLFFDKYVIKGLVGYIANQHLKQIK